MEVVPPAWLLAHTISFSLKLSAWKSYMGTSVSPIVIGTRRLVDRTRSPLFLAIADTKRKLAISGFEDGNRTLTDLHNTISNLLQYKKASALDEDRDGNTLLSVGNPLFTIHAFNF